jgi:soluble P-type ATPase
VPGVRPGMIEIDIPGFGALRIAHVVCDYNGTLAVDGRLLPGVRESIRALAAQVGLHVITADTFGAATAELAGLPVETRILGVGDQAAAKRAYVADLGADRVIAIGNGRNDREMLKAAAVGIAVVQGEGGAAETLACADVVTGSVLDALDLLRHPRRLIATLRS